MLLVSGRLVVVRHTLTHSLPDLDAAE